MPIGNQLDRIFDPDDPAISATFEQWRKEIMASRKWEVGGAVELDVGETGQTLFMSSGAKTPGRAVVGSGGVTASPNATTYGEGEGVLWLRGEGPALANRGTVTIYNPFVVPFVSGDIVVVVRDGNAWLIVGADCPA